MTIGIEHYDLGMVEALGGVLVDVLEAGERRREYAIEAEGVGGVKEYGGRIPIFFAGGNAQFMGKAYPCVVIRRTAIDEDDGRKVGWNLESVQAAPYARVVELTDSFGRVVSGVDALRVKTRTFPYDLTYEVVAVARGGTARRDAQRMWMYLLSRFTPDGFALAVRDSEGVLRTYDAVSNNTVLDLNYLDLTMREMRYGVTVQVKGEIDFLDAFDVKSVSGSPVTTFGRL